MGRTTNLGRGDTMAFTEYRLEHDEEAGTVKVFSITPPDPSEKVLTLPDLEVCKLLIAAVAMKSKLEKPNQEKGV